MLSTSYHNFRVTFMCFPTYKNMEDAFKKLILETSGEEQATRAELEVMPRKKVDGKGFDGSKRKM